ncbi:helix-turn-helix transcriptional regulator [Streptomyces sp. NPDC005438]|uniref:helix-turn-helix domain-containing protein n=1 Tax=Streptomyces sp. NPDC005438 TaxID=3156880 RepID=UPI0033AD484B
MARSPSSSAQRARQALADRLAELCRDAGHTGATLAAECGWHPSKSSRVMNARTLPSADDIRVWARACGAEEQAADLIESLRSAEGMWIGWRRMERTGLRQAQERRLPLFERTYRFRAYSSWFVPGLLQTAAYTEAVLRAVQRRRVAVDDVAEAVAVRMDRQQVLTEGSRRFAFLVEESVLRNGPCTADALRAQLDRLLDVASRPHVSLGVVPASTSRRRMPVEGFWIFDQEQVNVELVAGYLTVTEPSEIAAYEDTFVQLRRQAVYGESLRALVAEVRSGLR